MIRVLNDLKLGKARSATSWKEILRTFQPREWSTVPTRTGRMAYTVLEGDRGGIGRMLALVMMEDCQAPEVAMPSGSMMLTIRGQLTIFESNEERLMEPWDLVHLGGTRQGPSTQGLYLGMWAFPSDDILLRMIESGASRR